YHFIREVLEAKTVEVLKVGTEHNVADVLTKVIVVIRSSNQVVANQFTLRKDRFALWAFLRANDYVWTLNNDSGVSGNDGGGWRWRWWVAVAMAMVVRVVVFLKIQKKIKVGKKTRFSILESLAIDVGSRRMNDRMRVFSQSKSLRAMQKRDTEKLASLRRLLLGTWVEAHERQLVCDTMDDDA
nr:hypothetical protein [Tanacetum cinerariifolium]